MFTLSPAIDRYNAIQSALSQSQSDPINNGAMKGMDAAKSSLSLSPPQMNRPTPMARGISRLASGIQAPQPGTGRAGMLQSIAQAMGPAMETYYNAQDNDAALQMKQQQDMAHQEQDLLKTVLQHNENKRYHDAVLDERRKHHELQYGNPQDILEEQKRVKEQYGSGFDLLEKYPVNSRLRMTKEKDIADWAEKANNSAVALHSIEGMRKIFNDHPNLWGKVDIALLKKHEHDPDIVNTLARNAKVSKDDLAAFQELATYAKELLVANSKDVSAKGLNMYMEKRMNAAIPDLGTVPAAAAKMLDSLEKPHAFNYDVGSKKVDYANEGLTWRTPIKGKHKITKKYGEEEISPEIPAQTKSAPVDLSSLSMEDIDQLIADKQQSGQM